ncbi:hypothetical protein ACFRAE_06015 [Sphingobacterium sp. HJSM2_6]|uniref:hypothetical protein n=1 Tax=Sphingobacterium sp. HJSM2_6 TaxID=3366264 RepID=UPI003BE49A5D
MKKNQKQLIYAFLFSLICILSCSKEHGEFVFKRSMLTVSISGYNTSGNFLEVKIDTIKSEYLISPNNQILFGAAYTFLEGQEEVQMTISEKESGKIILEKQLKKGAEPIKISFLYMDGKLLDFPTIPPKEEGKIKIQYIYKPTTAEFKGPVDIVFGRYYFIPKVFEEFARIKNLNPNELSEPITFDTFSTTGLTYNGQATPTFFRAHLYKAGTNEPITSGTDYIWNALNSTVPTPSSSTASSKFYIFSDYIQNNTLRFYKNLEL